MSHKWNISGVAVSRDGVRVFPAVCSGCGETRDFPVHPEFHVGRGRNSRRIHATASECRGTIVTCAKTQVGLLSNTDKPTKPIGNGYKTTAKSTNVVSEEIEKEKNDANQDAQAHGVCHSSGREDGQKPTHCGTAAQAQTGAHQSRESEVVTMPHPTGAFVHARGMAYKAKWPQILADAKELGADATREKHGIPPSTWLGWLHKRPDLAAACGKPIVPNSAPNNGHKAEPVKAKAKLPKVDKEQDRIDELKVKIRDLMEENIHLRTQINIANDKEQAAKGAPSPSESLRFIASRLESNAEMLNVAAAIAEQAPEEWLVA